MIEDLKKLKTHTENNTFNEDELKFFNKKFLTDNTIIKKLNNLKTIDNYQKKNTIPNKVNSILNKLSSNNLFNLIDEFVNNIGKITIDEYKEVQKTFYLKIINEIKFIDNYLKYIKIISYLYFTCCGFSLDYFINIVEYVFKYTYRIDDIIFNKEFQYVNDISSDEIKRSNNLLIINKLFEHGFVTDKLISYCDNILLSTKTYNIDIYHWLIGKKISTDMKKQLRILLYENNENIRFTTLIEKLIL